MPSVPFMRLPEPAFEQPVQAKGQLAPVLYLACRNHSSFFTSCIGGLGSRKVWQRKSAPRKNPLLCQCPDATFLPGRGAIIRALSGAPVPGKICSCAFDLEGAVTGVSSIGAMIGGRIG